MLLITILVLTCTILALFSQEVANFLKKIASIPGAVLLIPLLIASMLVVYCEAWIIWIFLNLKRSLYVLAFYITGWFAGESRFFLPFMNIFILIFVSMAPIVLVNFLSRKKPQISLNSGFFTSLVLWLLVSILLTVSYSYSIGSGLTEY